MIYYNINQPAERVNFKDALIKGQGSGKGLFFPSHIPKLDDQLIENKDLYSNEEIALKVMQPYVGNEMPENKLKEIIAETINFDIPLVALDENISCLELFHGPTLAFKDVGARFMSRCLGYFLQGQKKQVTVLVATSGDTGGAVANGFYGVGGVDVVILYPSGKVSPVQEKQLTTLGKNIHAIEVEGTFDDCQNLVKQAFADEVLEKEKFLTSANSINVARWLPQQLYYFFALKQWKDKKSPPVISVPSGNFGNICAGILAMESGLPIKHFIAACNINDVVSNYLETETLQPKQTQPTLSNAMDVGNPSNFVRIQELFGRNFMTLKSKLSAYTISDEETLKTIKTVFDAKDYLLDPHGAVAYLALEKYLGEHPNEKGIFLETAHPVKFPEAIEKLIGKSLEVPDSLTTMMEAEKQSTKMGVDFGALKNYLLKDEFPF